MNILVTGGAGFIGANFLRKLVPAYPEHQFINLDKLTYAGNLHSVHDLQTHPNYRFVRADLANWQQMSDCFEQLRPDIIVHFAAESHVDRSIADAAPFIHTNLLGTYHLLELARRQWQTDASGKLFHHISTDEVYGSLADDGLFSESTAYDPSSPYSASKAGSDHLVMAYHRTYGLPVTLSNCSNNYGPYQFPEKLIPLVIQRIVRKQPIPVYGTGSNIRDWLYVEDHVEAIWRIIQQAPRGAKYNIGGRSERRNLEVVHLLCDLTDEMLARTNSSKQLITMVSDRPGHDYRYAIDCSKIEQELGWRAQETFASGLRKTVQWYLQHAEWIEQIESGAYRATDGGVV